MINRRINTILTKVQWSWHSDQKCLLTILNIEKYISHTQGITLMCVQKKKKSQICWKKKSHVPITNRTKAHFGLNYTKDDFKTRQQTWYFTFNSTSRLTFEKKKKNLAFLFGQDTKCNYRDKVQKKKKKKKAILSLGIPSFDSYEIFVSHLKAKTSII